MENRGDANIDSHAEVVIKARFALRGGPVCTAPKILKSGMAGPSNSSRLVS